MLVAILTFFVVASAFMHIRAEYFGPRSHVYVFKPLTMVFILFIAGTAPAPEVPFYRCGILAGLFCSLAGDIFLMLPSDRFVAGLVAFLVAHLFYIAAFASGTRFQVVEWSIVPFVIYGVLMFVYLSPGLGKLKLPVLLYVLVILAMTWRAWERWDQTAAIGAPLAFVGALLFLFSDSILAVNRFRREFRSYRALNLSSYFAAQWLIAMSVVGQIV